MINGLKKNRAALARAGGTLLALILLFVLLKEESGAEILFALKSIPRLHLLAAVLALLVSRLFVAGRWHALLRSAGLDIAYARVTRLTFTGLFASNFLPTTIGGDVARLAGVMQLGYDRAVCLASLIADRLIGMAGMALTLPFGIIPALSLPASAIQTSGFFLPLYQNLIRFMRRAWETFRLWTRRPLGLALSLLATLGNMAFIFLAIWLLTAGMGQNVSYGLIAGLWSLTYFVTLIPISINGFGVQELSLTFLLSALGGLDHSQSLTVAILIRLLFIITSLPGAFFLPAVLAEMNQAQDSQPAHEDSLR